VECTGDINHLKEDLFNPKNGLCPRANAADPCWQYTVLQEALIGKGPIVWCFILKKRDKSL